MHIGTQVTRALAVTATLTVASLGAVTTAQAMDPGNGNGKGNAHGHGQTKQPDASGQQHDHTHPDSGTQPGKKGTHDPGSNGKGHRPASGPVEAHGKAHAKGHVQAHGKAHAKGHVQGSAGTPESSSSGDSRPADTSSTRDASQADPPGNNGTVKITPPGEDDGIPQNHPHEGCVFDIEWYGFDRGDDIWSTVVFEDHSPTADGGFSVSDGDLRVFVGGDPASGGTDLDGEETYRLDFTGEPHPKQGYHVKLTVHTPGSQGADTKHKVYWVTGCEDVSPPTETPTTPGDETTSPPDVGGTETAAGPPDRGPDVKGVQETSPANLPTVVDAGVATVRWVASPLPLLLVLLGGLVAGLGYLVRRRGA